MSIGTLEKAIEFEKEGIDFYSKALKVIKHDLCRKILQSLLDEEKKHIEKLKTLHSELKRNGAWPDNETTTVGDRLINIYKNASETLIKTLKPSTNEKEILDLSMALETKGKKQYKQFAEEAEDKKEKEFFEILSREEEKHFEYLEQHFNYYWDSGLKMQE